MSKVKGSELHRGGIDLAKMPDILLGLSSVQSKEDFRVLLYYYQELKRIKQGAAYAVKMNKADKRSGISNFIRLQFGVIEKQVDLLIKAHIATHPLTPWAKRVGYHGVAQLASLMQLEKLKGKHSFAALLGTTPDGKYHVKGDGRSWTFNIRLKRYFTRLSLYNGMESKNFRNLLWHFRAKTIARCRDGQMPGWEERVRDILVAADPGLDRVVSRHWDMRCNHTCFFKRQAHIVGGADRPHLPFKFYADYADVNARRVFLGHIMEGVFLVERGYRPLLGQTGDDYIPPPSPGHIPGWKRAQIVDCWGGENNVIECEDWKRVTECDFWDLDAYTRFLRTGGYWGWSGIKGQVAGFSSTEEGVSGDGMPTEELVYPGGGDGSMGTGQGVGESTIDTGDDLPTIVYV